MNNSQKDMFDKKNEENIEKEEDVIENVVPPPDIFAFNESRSCADLKRMCDKKQLDISPDFQREEVWNTPAKTRFLDSLLKNLPIPSMCISLDRDSQKRIVIDGLQRISTIVQFLNAVENDDQNFILSQLEDVDSRLSGKTAEEIKKYHPEVIETIENASIPITILRCSLNKENHMEYIFTIFHRLNTGGTKLNNQEIRNCIFNGKLNNLLFDCAEKKKNILSKLLGFENSRFSYEEFILRFFAFQDNLDNYKGNLVRFLNNYMKDKRDMSDDEIQLKSKKFCRSIELISSKVQIDNISKTLLEAMLYGVGKNYLHLESEDDHQFQKRIESFFSAKEFHVSELQEGILKTSKVKSRLIKAQSIFN